MRPGKDGEIGAPRADEDLAAWLEDALRWISERSCCAGWLDEIEFLVWRGIEQLPRDLRELLVQADAAELEMLHAVAQRIGQWPTWTDQGVVLVDLSDWQDRYDAWQGHAS